MPLLLPFGGAAYVSLAPDTAHENENLNSHDKNFWTFFLVNGRKSCKPLCMSRYKYYSF